MLESSLDIENIMAELSKGIFGGNEVGDILKNPTEYPTEIVERLSIKTALDYWNGKIDYDAGDCIMNNIYSFWAANEYYFKNYEFSDIAWDCYNAFDSGEYRRKEDEPDIDSAEKYTKPLIEIFLRDRKLIT